MLTDIKLSKSYLPKIIQSGGFLRALLGKFVVPLMKVAIPLVKNVLAVSVAKGSASALNDATQRKIFGRVFARAGKEITLVISIENMDGIVRIIKSLKNSNILIGGVSVKHEIKNQEGGIVGILLGICDASMLGNMMKWEKGKGVARAGKGVIVAGRGYNNVDHVSNIEIIKYLNYKPRFNGVCSRDNLSRIKDWALIINLNDK